jgi:protein TonB
MAPEPPGWSAWIADHFRRTNWIAAGIAAGLQLGFVAVLILMGVVPAMAPKHDRPLVTVLASAERSATPPAPAAVETEQRDKPVVQPKTDVVVPPVKVVLSASAPVAAPVQRTPDPPAPAPAAAASAAPAAQPAPSAGSGSVKADLTSNLLSAPSPVFPMSSRRKHESGTVVLRVVVGEDGRVDQISVQRSSGFPALDEAALSAVRRWRWSRTMRDGRPVVVTGSVAVNMILRES